jgi:hypothetical protein
MKAVLKVKKTITDFIHRHNKILLWFLVGTIIILCAIIGALVRICVYLKSIYLFS